MNAPLHRLRMLLICGFQWGGGGGGKERERERERREKRE
jgi:hypothetical protein